MKSSNGTNFSEQSAESSSVTANGVAVPSKNPRVVIVTHYIPFRCTLVGSSALQSSRSPVLRTASMDKHRRDSNMSRFHSSSHSSEQGYSSSASGSFYGSGATSPVSPSHLGTWRFTHRRDHSALYAGILSLRDKYDTIIVGQLDKIYDERNNAYDTCSLSDELKKSLSERLLADYKCVPVFIDQQTSYGHYEGFCKGVLWPIFHYILWNPTDGNQEKSDWKSYNKVNQLFADEVLKLVTPDDQIWVHDYHFLLVPSMLRASLPTAVIGFFLHTPFPSSELFRCLPQRRNILIGVLGANMVGFQTYSYARHFISSCTRVLGCESTPTGVEYLGSMVSIAIFPIGIDVKQVEDNTKRPGVIAKIAAIKEIYADKKIIIGRDKLDEIKGVIHKLNAFEMFLKKFPEWQDKVVLIQVTSPTESSYRLETKVSEAVSRINGQYGSLGFAPVHHYHHHIDKDEYYALLTIADVALITAIRDGMNTTSHEYVVCQSENQGPLILSEFTGTAGSLSSAMLVNPWDNLGVANAIADALNMPKEERLLRHKQLYENVTMNTASFWAESLVKELISCSRKPDLTNFSPELDVPFVLERFKSTKKRVFMLDYDGTLTQIRSTPNAAVPSDEILHALTVLCKLPDCHVFIISGRDQKALDEWLGHIENIGLSAEHGSFIKYPNQKNWVNLSKEIDLSWKNDVLPIFEYYTERTPGSFIEEKLSSLTWHYRLADPSYGVWQAQECHNHLENAVLSKLPVEVLVGKKNLEVRPQMINKGEIVKRLLSTQTQLGAELEFVFCAGDDKTDEDMFKALRKVGAVNEQVFTCTVGLKKTTASWHVPRTEDIIQLLSQMATIALKE